MFLIFDEIDHRIAGWMERYGHLILRISLGIIFAWFATVRPPPTKERFI